MEIGRRLSSRSFVLSKAAMPFAGTVCVLAGPVAFALRSQAVLKKAPRFPAFQFKSFPERSH
jgi:hypothetical protein